MLVYALLMATLASPATAKDVSFLGFSRNDALAAWRVVVHHPQHDGSVDTFALVKLVDIKHDQPVASFKDSNVSRRDVTGHAAQISQQALALANPEYVHAAPQSLWHVWRKRGHFRSVRLDFGDSLVRLHLDNDVAAQVHADKKVLEVDAPAGTKVGYTPVARLFEGQMLPLGHYVLSGDPSVAPHGEVEIYHSYDGTCIAVLSRARGAHGAIRNQASVVVTPPTDPIASTKVGTFPMVEEQSRSAAAAFKELHPDLAKSFDSYIGAWF